MVKFVKNIQKIRIFRANRSIFASDSLESRANHSHRSFLKSIRSDLLTSLFCKERCERIAHGCSLKCAILSERAKSERVNSQPWIYQNCSFFGNILEDFKTLGDLGTAFAWVATLQNAKRSSHTSIAVWQEERLWEDSSLTKQHITAISLTEG